MGYQTTNRVFKKIGLVILGLAFFAFVIFLTMSLWNWLIPEIFHGPVITYWQAFGLLLLGKLLFGWHGHSHGWGGGWRHKREWKEKLRERMTDMTPEQREKVKEHFRNYCRPYGRGFGRGGRRRFDDFGDFDDEYTRSEKRDQRDQPENPKTPGENESL
ncbi:MAG TPA: hypothetical protein VM802_17105 [Chitinophaga sp.]|uniref:hypothetical protein n=1 Tax=Chitinophaga sp. TaxID=1869181 RepID=UPI002CB963EC|nr:hypothetical protein [Chitinophaga sp.]HVI46599.1 hypothetical protein [Chitinophaga sp.]